MINILIAEDNEKLRALLKIHLTRAGYRVYEAENGETALTLMDGQGMQLVIADIMMPVMDGYRLTRELRESGCTVPVLIISAKDAIADKRQGFRLGADDYMTKPVDMEELLIRVEALLRRCNIERGEKLTVGNCVIDAGSLTVLREGARVELRHKEFQLLQKLLASPNRIFTRQALMDDIWGYDSESDPRTVDTHIKRLREKLADFEDFEIVTVRGLGYKAVIRE